MTTTTSAKQSPTIVLNIPSAINQLVKEPSGRRILSAFIDTSPARLERHAHLLAFRDGCKAIRPHLDGVEKDLFEAAVRRVERYLLDASTQKGQGVALFLGAPGSGLIVVPLPRRPVLECNFQD